MDAPKGCGGPSALATSRGPESGPMLSGEAPGILRVLDADGAPPLPIGTAYQAGQDRDGFALFMISLDAAAFLPGLWTVQGRRFILAPEGTPIRPAKLHMPAVWPPPAP